MSSSDGDPVEELAEQLGVSVAGGDSLDGAVRRLLRLGVPSTLLEQARRSYEIRVGRIRDLKDPGALVDRERRYKDWYDGPKSTDVFWPPLSDRLLSSIGRESLDDVDEASNKILGLMRPPGVDQISSRGLVLGYVQSGKTTSFMSVVAKGADVGYRLFVVLSGITDNLRSQTQDRLEDVLVGELTKEWYLLTSKEEDFLSPGNAANLLSRADHRMLAVVKKNPYRLRRLLRWLESAGSFTLARCPILVIDDEADQASLDVGVRGRTSRINGLISQILRQPKAAYVAYTATPFANLLTDARGSEGLYPRDFIVDLPRSDGYFGPERLFGRDPLTPDEAADGLADGLDLVRYVDTLDVPSVQPPRGRGAVYSWDPTIPESLDEALRWFVLATATRRARGAGNQHSSMLIHTTMLAEGHERLSQPVRDYLRELSLLVDKNDSTMLGELRDLWMTEMPRVSPQDEWSTDVTWEQVSAALPGVIAEVAIVVDNYRSTARLSYSDDSPTIVVVIGGNTLSRGLTLEGLVCSYFIRAASAYDTLLQMGRWFGYRRGYGDLVRIWMTPDLESWFFDLATVEEEIRRDIYRYEAEDRTPAELAVRIRTHPTIAITSAAKMRNAVRAEVSFGGSRQQTILFNHEDEDWLNANWTAGEQLILDARHRGIADTPASVPGRFLLEGLASESIISFLNSYSFHERAYQMRRDLLIGYIEGQNAQDHLRNWNVVVMGHATNENGQASIGLDGPVNLIRRSRMKMPGIQHANIKSLVSKIDRVSDLSQTQAQLAAMVDQDVTDGRLLELREQLVGDVGLLCLYPISKDSQPKLQTVGERKRQRTALGAVGHVLGVALFFPESRGLGGSVSYMAADLSSSDLEDVDVDIDALDFADQAAGEAAEQQGG